MAQPEASTPPQVLMYARNRFCPDVARVRARLSDQRVEWQEIDIEADTQAAATVERLTGERRVPTLVIGAAVLVEPRTNELDTALMAAGYALPAGDSA